MSRAIRSGGAVAMTLLLVSGASGQDPAPTLTIDGTSTVRSWTCEAESFAVVPNPPTGFEAAVLNGERGLETVTLTFPVKTIECGNGKMNDHLRNALGAEKHPEIRYRLSRYDIESAASGVVVQADGELMIAGTARPITMAVTVTQDATGAIRVRGQQEVNMTDYGVKPPKLMLGTLKVGDTVTVKFDVPLRPQQVKVAVRGEDGSESNR